MSNELKCRLYLITPPRLNASAFADTMKAALDAGDVACVQLRLKDENEMIADGDTIRRTADILMPLVQSYEAAFILNDAVAIADDIDADGVHIGQEDMAYADARALMGPDKIIGVTCHNDRHHAMLAGEQGADYVAFGAFYDTDTKIAKTRAEPEILTWWSEIFEVPCVAIGGITPDNAAPLVHAGADFLAVSSGVWAHAEGPAAAVRRLNQIMSEESRKP